MEHKVKITYCNTEKNKLDIYQYKNIQQFLNETAFNNDEEFAIRYINYNGNIYGRDKYKTIGEFKNWCRKQIGEEEVYSIGDNVEQLTITDWLGENK